MAVLEDLDRDLAIALRVAHAALSASRCLSCLTRHDERGCRQYGSTTAQIALGCSETVPQQGNQIPRQGRAVVSNLAPDVALTELIAPERASAELSCMCPAAITTPPSCRSSWSCMGYLNALRPMSC